jgi:hypothetical protein
MIAMPVRNEKEQQVTPGVFPAKPMDVRGYLAFPSIIS